MTTHFTTHYFPKITLKIRVVNDVKILRNFVRNNLKINHLCRSFCSVSKIEKSVKIEKIDLPKTQKWVVYI